MASVRNISTKDFQLKVILVVLFLMLGWVLLEYTSLLYRSYQIEQKKNWFISENERLIRNNDELAKRYEYYKTDYFFRKEAKRKLNRKEPGEKVMIISGGDKKIISQNSWDLSEDMLSKWYDYFFNEEY